ncbi:hypothetical protein PTTG_29415 [Puccinia triticina 1-1 BBBD Race 1]|uniref:Aconitase_C domain-containing protein n=2 Tax=Puccinia triticina TaxID=208348 RepID=A0A180G4B9_PUCT1|nr:uncharacterized protein PtA15_11A224 [Puccinia triticina]OAV87481.1 hypothetical protein PTTG_29415 [Puccinia triticina 1-1 BBBD Race 1]WAQ89535.1 hypothetical protein PtA15_11A224 [Puccinia triticina]
MENYDRSFAETAREFYRSPSTGTLPPPAQQSRKTGTGAELVIGPNFSTGLSREKAATALRNAGIRLVIAASFGKILQQNAINNSREAL